MNIEQEKVLIEQNRRLIDSCQYYADKSDKTDVELLDAKIYARRYKGIAKILAGMIAIFLVWFVIALESTTTDPVYEHEKTKAELDDVVDAWGKEVEYYQNEIEFLENANEFGFCDPRPMAEWMDRCDVAVDENAEHYAHVRDCEENLSICTGALIEELKP